MPKKEYKQTEEHINKRMINAKKSWFKKGEKAKNWNGFKKGNNVWNKGLPKELQPNYGKHRSEETRLKISLGNRKPKPSLKGHKFNLGKHRTEKQKEKLRKFNLGRKRPGTGKFISERNRNNNPMKNPEIAKKHSETMKRLYKEGKINRFEITKKANESIRKNGLPQSKGKPNLKMSEIMKIKWQNPEFREKRIKATLRGLFKRPTSLEQDMIDIIQRNSLPYKYVGDGSFLIGYKNPDFVNVNGEKICIEIRPSIMCKFWDNITPEEYEKKRIEHYTKYGWKCLVFFADRKLNNRKLNEKDINNKLSIK